MLDASLEFDIRVSARLLEFLSWRAPWTRRLWNVGLVLTLEEVLEANDAVRAKALSQKSLKHLIDCARLLAGADFGFESPAHKGEVIESLVVTGDGRIEEHECVRLRSAIELLRTRYLSNWANALRSQLAPSYERTAWAAATHLLDAGYNSDFLHRWWTLHIRRPGDAQSLADLFELANVLGRKSDLVLKVYFALANPIPPWLKRPDLFVDEKEFGSFLERHGGGATRHNGAFRFEVRGKDSRAAISAATERFERFATRLMASDGDNPIQLGPHAWVEGDQRRYEREQQQRYIGLIVPASPSTEAPLNNIDAALELLAPLGGRAPCPAVAGAWAAIESLLSPIASDRVVAGDRLATIATAAYPRSELQLLSRRVRDNSDLAAELRVVEAESDLTKVIVVAKGISRSGADSWDMPADHVAAQRILSIIQRPTLRLRDVKTHLVGSLRRLYRLRNLILHMGKTDPVALRAGLAAAAPIVGAGMSRIATAAEVHGLGPVGLAARAHSRIATLASGQPSELSTLLD